MNIVAAILKCFFRQNTKKTLESSLDIDAKLFNRRNDIVVVATSSIPHRDIARVLGNVTGTSNTQACTKELFELAEKEARLDLIEKAQLLGANAVVDMKIISGSYEPEGSIWHLSQTVYSGTAVVVS
jgi:uncharacterized protein YbjQ (UPF0145 family)